MKTKKLITCITLATLIMGCTSSNSGKVIRVDPRKMQDTDANYGSEDLHIFVEKMVDSMLQSPVLKKKAKPYLALGNIKIGVGVDEHIDTVLIKNSIRTNLIKSTKVNFLDSRYLDKSKVIAKDYELRGDVHSIKKNTNSTIDNFYALTLILTDVKTSAIVWTEEKEIRKLVKK
jgi:PBP1b-binding outer membrane lipoprotein LpoB